MKYVYPKLSSKDLMAFRLGGAGLGNLLFTYGRALAFAKRNDAKMIWPTWPSIKVGPWLRREKDKRTYIGLFSNRDHEISGLRKVWLLLSRRKVSEGTAVIHDEEIVVFEKFIGSFAPIRDDHQLIREHLLTNMKDDTVLQFDFSDAIAIHVRLGDFRKVQEQELRNGIHDSRLPIDWYCEMLAQVRSAAGQNVKAYVFSDGTDEELKKLLDMPNTERITFGNAINDIVGLSQAPLLIASGSSFSMWARYLGRHSTICYPNQIKEHILTERDAAFEIEAEDTIPDVYREEIKRMFRSRK